MKTLLLLILLVIGLLLWSFNYSHAQTVYFAGGEDTDFSFVGTVTPAAALSSGYRNTYSRGYLNPVGAAVSDPPTNYFSTPAFTAVNTLWVHFQWGGGAAGCPTSSGAQMVRVLSPDGVARILVRGTGVNGQLKASTRNAAGTITDLATATANLGNCTTNTVPIDIEIIYGCTTGDTILLYENGVQVINYTGASICTDSATSLNEVQFGYLNAVANTTSGTFSEVIAASGNTLGMALWTLTPVAAGNTQAWSGVAANINKFTINDASFISTGTNNLLSEWTTSDIPPPSGGWSVLAVVQSARALVGTTGPQHFQWAVRTGSPLSDNVTGSVAPNTSFNNFGNQVWATNPATLTSWQFSDLTASGFNLGVKSLP